METIDYEKLVISTALRWPNHKDNIIQSMVLSLDYTSFSSDNIAHQIIWKAISDLVVENRIVTIPSLCDYLGDNLEAIGGEHYLLALYEFSKQMKVEEPTDHEIYVKVVYTAGVLRDLGQVVSNYSKMYDDFEKLVSKTDNPEEIVHRMLDEVQVVLRNNIKTGFKPIGDAVDAALDKLAQVKSGKKIIIPVGFPTLEWYGLPYPRSFIVLQGLSSSGKTAFAFNGLALGTAIYLHENDLEGIVSLTSLETPDDIIATRMACCLKSIDSRKIRLGEFDKNEEERFIEGLEYVRKLPIVYDDNPTITTETLSLRAIAQNLINKRVLGISDYAELFADKTGNNEEQRVAQITRNIRQISWSTGSCEVLLSQVNKEALKNNSMIAGRDNSRQSNAPGHAADGQIELVNYPQLIEGGYTPIPLEGYSKDYAYGIIVKNKNGPLGHVAFRWEAPYTRFVDDKVIGLNKLFDYSKHLGITEFEIDEQEFDY